jgi:hypothetical protein
MSEREQLTCEVCGDHYYSDEPPYHPSLCPYHAVRIDRETDEKLENEHFDWFGE